MENTPDQILNRIAEFFKDRNGKYGSAYMRHGPLMEILFPHGVHLKSEKDFFAYHVIVMEVVKITRICNAFAKGEHHTDSWKDLIVYAAMILEDIENEK